MSALQPGDTIKGIVMSHHSSHPTLSWSHKELITVVSLTATRRKFAITKLVTASSGRSRSRQYELDHCVEAFSLHLCAVKDMRRTRVVYDLCSDEMYTGFASESLRSL